MDLQTVLNEKLRQQTGPVGERLRNAFVSALEDGLVARGRTLPSERWLADTLNVSRSTLRQCLKDLAGMGLVESRRGAGTVVIGYIPKALSKHSGFTEDLKLRGLEPASRVLEREIGPISSETAFRTGLPLQTRVMILARVRLAGTEPLSYERATIPVDTVGLDYDGTTSLYERMDARGMRPRRILQSLEAIGAPADIAALLGVAPGAAILKIVQLGYARNGKAVEDAISWYRGDRYRYIGEIRE